MSDSSSNEDEKSKEQKRKARNALDLQRMQLEQLMKNPVGFQILIVEFF